MRRDDSVAGCNNAATISIEKTGHETMSSQDPQRTAECARCKLKSTLPDLFRHGRIDGQRTGWLCPKCNAEQTAERSTWFLQAMCISAVLGGLLCWAGDMAGMGLIMVSYVCGFFFTLLLTPLHELAHAVTALALGVSVHSIVIGWFGKPLFSFQVRRCTIEVTRIPLGGLTYISNRSTRMIRLKMFMVSAAAPMLHVVLFGVAYFTVFHTDVLDAWPEWVSWLLIVFGAANLFEIAFNLWPRRISSHFGELDSDGLALLKLPFTSDDEVAQWPVNFYYYDSLARLRDRDYSGAIGCLHEALDRYPDNIPLKSCYGTVLVEQEQFEEAARVFESLRDSPELPPEYDALMLNNIAWIDVASKKSENLPRAQDYSRRAMDALPWNPAVKGTRGSVLVASGEFENGIDLLKTAFAENEDIHNRALNAAYLALAFARFRQLQEARWWYGTAKRLDPDCRQLEPVRQEIDHLESA
jgi:hypothetical protein